MTLREVLEKYPDSLDLPIAVLRIDGSLDYAVGVYPDYDWEDEDKEFNVLIISGN